MTSSVPRAQLSWAVVGFAVVGCGTAPSGLAAQADLEEVATSAGAVDDRRGSATAYGCSAATAPSSAPVGAGDVTRLVSDAVVPAAALSFEQLPEVELPSVPRFVESAADSASRKHLFDALEPMEVRTLRSFNVASMFVHAGEVPHRIKQQDRPAPDAPTFADSMLGVFAKVPPEAGVSFRGVTHLSSENLSIYLTRETPMGLGYDGHGMTVSTSRNIAVADGFSKSSTDGSTVLGRNQYGAIFVLHGVSAIPFYVFSKAGEAEVIFSQKARFEVVGVGRLSSRRAEGPRVVIEMREVTGPLYDPSRAHGPSGTR